MDRVSKPMSNDATELIYIAGTARSGSTILALLLGSSERMACIGEVTHLYRDGLSTSKTCSCGASVLECPVWKCCIPNLIKKFPNGESTLKNFDRHQGLFKSTFYYLTGRGIKNWLELNTELFNTVKQKFPKDTVLIDSSKYASRSLLLSKAFNSKTIIITRSPEGLLDSFSKQNIEQKSKRSLSVFFYFLYVSISLKIASILLGKRMLWITFDSLMNKPTTVLDSIEKFLDKDLSKAKSIVVNKTSFEFGHVLTGNRLIKSKKIKFQIQPIRKKSSFLIWLMKVMQKLLHIPA